MAQEQTAPQGPDLTQGIPLADLADGGKLVGHVGSDEVLLVRRGAEMFAVAAHCTHYHGPLVDGLVVDDTVRCPWHHACFDLRTGEALRAPALSPLACWSVEQRDGKIFVREKKRAGEAKQPLKSSDAPKKIVIVGGGAAGFAAAEMLRREQYQGSIVMLSDDDAPPVDRPNLSKDYLAGNGARGMAAAARRRVLFREQASICASKTKVAGDRCAARAKSSSRTAARCLTTACCSRPAPSRFACRSRAPICRTSSRCAPSPTAAPSSSARSSATRAVVHRRELHRARSRRVAAHARDRGARRGAREAADGARARAPDGRLRPHAARRARRRLPSRRHRDRDRAQPR